MDQPLTANPLSAIPGFLSGGGEMGQRFRSFDWDKTPLGHVESWPQSLRSALSICLNSNFPIAIYWGSGLTLLYNDAWSPIPGNKHPWSLGRPAKEVWPEIWDAIEPQFQKAFQGEPGGSKDALLMMERHGYTEECYFDFTFTPIYGEAGKVEGVFNAVIETTKTILNERQLQTLRDLGNLNTVSKTVDEVLVSAGRELQKNNKDFPFGIIYQIHSEEGTAAPISFLGINENQTVFPPFINLEKPTADTKNFYQSYSTNQIVVSENNNRRKNLPVGGWEKEATQFIHLPIISQRRKHPVAILLAALNPHRRYDAFYEQFVQLIADQISTEVNNALAYEEEKKRAEALAEIDKAKTAFFTNISHEFRTPLTLMLGSLEGLLQKGNGDSSAQAEAIEATHRNALRLLRLVNNLLDFSRIEAGKTAARFVLTDVAQLTRDLASNFRSAIEQAGLEFRIQINTVAQPVYIDREMWEKIVLNLLSNAFKYTLKGSISLSLTAKDNAILLKIKDTGVGIPQAELPKMFERFHRVQNVSGRTFEGTGIGLSLVKELVQLHGGSISVESKVGEGSQFTVTIPTGKTHLQQEQIWEGDTGTNETLPAAFIKEAASLIEVPQAENGKQTKNGLATVLVVDDNADMRRYMEGLLQKKYNVVTAGNGNEALQKIGQQKPDLVLSDVMMPVMDGVELLRSIKEDPVTSALPVILVSARAGEEAKVEGFETGADDYLIKPFSAKELLARVQSQISLVKKREQALQTIYNVFDEVPFAVAVLKGKSLVIEFINQYNLHIWQSKKEDVIGRPLFDVRPDIQKAAEPIHTSVYETGERFMAHEIPIEIQSGEKLETRYFTAIVDPLLNEQGEITGQLATSIETTEQVVARKVLEETNRQLQFAATLTDNIADAVIGCTTPEEGYRIVSWNKGAEAMYGWKASEVIGRPAGEAIETHFSAGDKDRWKLLLDKNGSWRGEVKQKRKDGKTLAIAVSVSYVKDGTGRVLGSVAVNRDITQQKEAEEKLLVAQKQLELTIENVPAAVYLHDNRGNILYVNKVGLANVRSILGDDFDANDDLNSLMKKGAEKVIYKDESGQVLTMGNYPMTIAMQTRKEAELLIKREYKESGEVNWFVNKATPLLNDTGEVEFILSTSTDLTKEKQAQTALQEGRERLQAALNASRTGTFRWNIQTNELSWDQNLDRLFGLTENQTVQNLSSFIEKVHPYDREGVIESCRRCASEGADFDMEFRVIWPDGTVHWLDDKGKTYLDEIGVPHYMTGACVDITERKLATGKIMESEQRFQGAVKAVQGILWTNNARGEMEGVQAGWSALTGQSYEAYQGYGWANAVHPDDAQATIDAWSEAVRERKTFVFEHRVKRSDGSWGQYSIRAIPLMNPDDSIREWVGVHTDVTEQRKSEEKIKESERRFRMLAETLPQLVWMTNEKGEQEYASAKWKEYTGVEPTGPETWGKIVHPDDLPAIDKAWSESMTTGHLYRSEARLKNKAGEYRWHFAQGEPIRDAEGKIIKWIGAFTDIHDQKTLTEKLEGLVEERTVELQRSNEDLQQFAHVASHDLKEPVRKVMTFGNRLKQEFGTELPERANLYLSKIESSAIRMYSMIDGVLLYSSLNALEQTKELIDLNEVLQNIEADLEVPLAATGGVVRYAELPQIEGASILIYQLFYNLINNSLKFTRPGVAPVIEISFRASTAEEIRKTGSPTATEYLTILVKDNGIGFTNQAAEKIFGTFTRLHSKDKYEGTGLGLALCRKIAERHKGVIFAEGKDGEGATFFIVLPKE